MLRVSSNGMLKEYKNGNITIKFDKDTLNELKDGYEVETLNYIIFWLDLYFIGETYCLSNWDTGHTIYNAYSDLVYVFPWRELETLKQGKTVRLYARKPDDTDREILESEGY